MTWLDLPCRLAWGSMESSRLAAWEISVLVVSEESYDWASLSVQTLQVASRKTWRPADVFWPPLASHQVTIKLRWLLAVVENLWQVRTYPATLLCRLDFVRGRHTHRRIFLARWSWRFPAQEGRKRGARTILLCPLCAQRSACWASSLAPETRWGWMKAGWFPRNSRLGFFLKIFLCLGGGNSELLCLNLFWEDYPVDFFLERV